MNIYGLRDWPRFHWDMEKLAEPLASVRYRQGGLIGQVKGLGFRFQQEAVFETLTNDILTTREIEGEKLDAEQVRSSVARRLGLDIDVTEWMLWFLDCLGRAVDGAHLTLKAVIDKARFWDRIKDVQLNDRQ